MAETPKPETSTSTPEVSSSDTRRKWFAVYTTCRHEKRVAEHFARRTIEHFLPLYHAHRRWKDGSRVKLSLPLFPSYIFVRIQPDERVPVLTVPGVVWVVGRSPLLPTPLPEREIETLRGAVNGMVAEPYPEPVVGQRVRIRAGALAGIEGVIVRRKNCLRVVMTLDLIMRSIAIEVSADEIELIGGQRRAVSSSLISLEARVNATRAERNRTPRVAISS